MMLRFNRRALLFHGENMRTLKDIKRENGHFEFVYRTSETEMETVQVSPHEFSKMQSLLKRAELASPGVLVSEPEEKVDDIQSQLEAMEKRIVAKTREEMKVVKDDYNYLRELNYRTIVEREHVWKELHKEAAVKLRTLENYFNASKVIEKNIFEQVEQWHNQMQERLTYLAGVIERIIESGNENEATIKKLSETVKDDMAKLDRDFNKAVFAVRSEFTNNTKMLEALKKEARLNIQTDILNKVDERIGTLSENIDDLDQELYRTQESVYRRVKRLTKVESAKQARIREELIEHVDQSAKGILADRRKVEKLRRQAARVRARRWSFWGIFRRRKK